MLRNSVYILIVIFVVSFLFNGCGNSNSHGNADKDSVNVKPKVSVYYLHQKKSCMTCKAIGNISRTTTEQNFSKEIKDGRVAFYDLDISDPANSSVADKFECTWSGLYILSSKDGKEIAEDLTDVAFMYAVNNPDTLEQIVKSVITEKL